MLVFVHTINVSCGDVVVSARVLQAVRPRPLALLGRRVAVRVRRLQPGRKPHRTHAFRAFVIGPQGRQNNSAGPLVTPKQERQVPALPAPPVHNDPSIQEPPLYLQHLAAEATAQQTSQWLQSNRFGSYLRTFASFSGADILRLSRDDLIQICGLADGIRLYNALHSKAIAPRLTMYLCLEQNNVYHALYMDNLSCGEMTGKLAHLMGITSEQIHDIYIQGPGGIHILITDEVVRNIKDEAMFSIEILQDQSGERYRLLLKPSPN